MEPKCRLSVRKKCMGLDAVMGTCLPLPGVPDKTDKGSILGRGLPQEWDCLKSEDCLCTSVAGSRGRYVRK